MQCAKRVQYSSVCVLFCHILLLLKALVDLEPIYVYRRKERKGEERKEKMKEKLKSQYFDMRFILLFLLSGQNNWLQLDRKVLDHDFSKTSGPLELKFLVR